ncbi:unnamed protein product [Vitrella brassicaformis CCMP3155]|uniref:E3 ubiquitin-protein ligase n=6 Tax=Vitrella brassicaformis TaxID=1169539 RepID=A0A0G4H2X0_VITBC|nr:unnamed protein product [Vitrella brassicaformis CCMP3155]|eukprot:CEM38024.1 unnamed protein product [Vitrella brassicaformis CCMP3155]
MNSCGSASSAADGRVDGEDEVGGEEGGLSVQLLFNGDVCTADEAIRGLTQELYGEQTLERIKAVERTLKAAQGNSGICGAVWGKNEICFKCYDCQADPTCAICAPCFFNGNHEGHNWRISMTHGGCCDCGDASSWNPRGFCRFHQGITPEMDGPGSLEMVPTKIRKVSRSRIADLVAYADSIFLGDKEDSKRRVAFSKIIEWLQSISGVCFGFRYQICCTLTDERLQRWIHKHDTLTSHEQRMMHNFYLALMISPNFKRRFCKIFAHNYRKLVESNALDSSLHGLSVQMFTVAELAIMLVHDGFVKTVLTALRSHYEIDKRTETVQPERTHGQGTAMRLMTDLQYLLNHRDVCAYALEDYETRQAFFDCLTLFNRMNLQDRYKDDHIPYENLRYEVSFPLEVQLINSTFQPFFEHCKRPEVVENVSALAFYSDLVDTLLKLPPLYNTSDKASFHIPLLRFLASSLDYHQVLRTLTGPLSTPHNALPPSEGPPIPVTREVKLDGLRCLFTPDVLTRIIRHCVGVLRFAAEIQEGYWVRNGETMRDQRRRYLEKDGLHRLDINLTQFAVTLLGHPPLPPPTTPPPTLDRPSPFPSGEGDVEMADGEAADGGASPTYRQQFHQQWSGALDPLSMLWGCCFDLTPSSVDLRDEGDGDHDQGGGDGDEDKKGPSQRKRSRELQKKRKALARDSSSRREGGIHLGSPFSIFKHSFLSKSLAEAAQRKAEALSSPAASPLPAAAADGATRVDGEPPRERHLVVQLSSARSETRARFQAIRQWWQKLLEHKYRVKVRGAPTVKRIRSHEGATAPPAAAAASASASAGSGGRDEGQDDLDVDIDDIGDPDGGDDRGGEFDSKAVSDAFRMNFFWSLVMRLLNEAFYIEICSCPRKTRPTDFRERIGSVIKRYIVQRLALNPLPYSHVEIAIPKSARHHPDFEMLLEEVADVQRSTAAQQPTAASQAQPPLIEEESDQDAAPAASSAAAAASGVDASPGGGGRSVYRLKPAAWALVDTFWAVGNRQDLQNLEETAMKQKHATLIGPTRFDSGMSMEYDYVRDLIADSFKDTLLLDLILDTLDARVKALIKMRKKHGAEEAHRAHGDHPHADPLFASILKILDSLHNTQNPLHTRQKLPTRIPPDASPLPIRSLSPSSAFACPNSNAPFTSPPLTFDPSPPLAPKPDPSEPKGGDEELMLSVAAMDGPGAESTRSATREWRDGGGEGEGGVSARSVVLDRLTAGHVDQLIETLSYLMEHMEGADFHQRCLKVLLPRVVSWHGRLKDNNAPEGAAKPLGPAASSRKARMDTAKQRQAQMLANFVKVQQNFSHLLEDEQDLDDEDEDAMNDTLEAPDERLLEKDDDLICCLCREKGTPESPLALLASVSVSDVLPRVAKRGKRAMPWRCPAITTCGHVGHLSCLGQHLLNVKQRHETGEFFFVSVEMGEFPCPMCRALSNIRLPYLPLSYIVHPDSFNTQTLMWRPHRPPHPPPTDTDGPAAMDIDGAPPPPPPDSHVRLRFAKERDQDSSRPLTSDERRARAEPLTVQASEERIEQLTSQGLPAMQQDETDGSPSDRSGPGDHSMLDLDEDHSPASDDHPDQENDHPVEGLRALDWVGGTEDKIGEQFGKTDETEVVALDDAERCFEGDDRYLFLLGQVLRRELGRYSHLHYLDCLHPDQDIRVKPDGYIMVPDAQTQPSLPPTTREDAYKCWTDSFDQPETCSRGKVADPQHPHLVLAHTCWEGMTHVSWAAYYELLISAALRPNQIALSVPPVPLYVTLIRNALLYRLTAHWWAVAAGEEFTPILSDDYFSVDFWRDKRILNPFFPQVCDTREEAGRPPSKATEEEQRPQQQAAAAAPHPPAAGDRMDMVPEELMEDEHGVEGAGEHQPPTLTHPSTPPQLDEVDHVPFTDALPAHIPPGATLEPLSPRSDDDGSDGYTDVPFTPWGCDVRRALMSSFVAGKMTSPGQMREAIRQLMTVRAMQVLNEVIIGAATTQRQTQLERLLKERERAAKDPSFLIPADYLLGAPHGRATQAPNTRDVCLQMALNYDLARQLFTRALDDTAHNGKLDDDAALGLSWLGLTAEGRPDDRSSIMDPFHSSRARTLTPIAEETVERLAKEWGGERPPDSGSKVPGRKWSEQEGRVMDELLRVLRQARPHISETQMDGTADVRCEEGLQQLCFSVFDFLSTCGGGREGVSRLLWYGSEAERVAGRAALWELFQQQLHESLSSFMQIACWIVSCLWQLHDTDKNRVAFLSNAAAQRFTALAQVLGMPQTLDDCLDPSLLRQAVNVMWHPELRPSGARHWRRYGVSVVPPQVDRIEPVKFCHLPKTYVEVIRMTYGRKSAICGKLPEEPALCLLCGCVVAVNLREHDQRRFEEGECTRHARTCGNGQGVFFLTHKALLLLVDAPKNAFTDVPYVDRHGETDQHLARGRPMTFNPNMNDNLRLLYTRAEIAREIIRNGERTSRYIPTAL